MRPVEARIAAHAPGEHRIGDRGAGARTAAIRPTPSEASCATLPDADPRRPAATGTRRVRKRSSEIIDAAAAVFSERGYHGTSTQAIAAQLGIRQASVYYYFRSKEAALERVCEVGVEGFLERARAIAACPSAARARLEAIVLQHMLPMNDRPDYVRVFMTQRRFLPPPARKRVAALAARYERVVQGVVEDGIRSGEFRDDLAPEDVMLTLIGACNAANHWQGIVKGMSVERAAGVVSALVLDGLARPSTAQARAPAAPRRPARARAPKR